MEAKKIEEILTKVEEQKKADSAKIEEISTKFDGAISELKSKLEATENENKATKENLESTKAELNEYKEALENEKKAKAALFADAKAKEENSRDNIISEYKKSFGEALRTKSYNIEEKTLEKAVNLYVKEKMGSHATDADMNKVKSEMLAQAKSNGTSLLEFKTLREGVSPDGGYLAKNPELGEIQKREFASLNFRNIAYVQNISSESIDFPLDDGLFANVHYGEESTRSTTDTSEIGKVSIKAGEIWAEPVVTLKMIEDSAIDIEAWISDKTNQSFDLTEEQDFMVGTGTNDRAKGLFTYSAWSSSTVYERNKLCTLTISSDTELADAIIDLYEILPNRAKANAVYLMHPTTWRVILRLKDGVSRYLLNANMLAAGYGKTLYGRPVILSDYIAPMFAISGSTVTEISGAKGIACGDMRETYAIIDRIGLTKLTDPYTSKGFIKFSARKRVGGGVKNFQTCKILAIA